MNLLFPQVTTKEDDVKGANVNKCAARTAGRVVAALPRAHETAATPQAGRQGGVSRGGLLCVYSNTQVLRRLTGQAQVQQRAYRPDIRRPTQTRKSDNV